MSNIIEFNPKKVPKKYDSEGIIAFPINDNLVYNSMDTIKFLNEYPTNNIEVLNSIKEDIIEDPNTGDRIRVAVFDFKGYYGTNYILCHKNKILTITSPLPMT